EAFRQSGATDWFFSLYPLDALTGFVGHMKLAGIFVVGSNLVSNVPFILVVQDQVAALAVPERAWTLLAVTSTFPGNLTLLGSAANVIVAEAARPIGGLGFWQHILIGAPIAVLTTLAGAFWFWVVV